MDYRTLPRLLRRGCHSGNGDGGKVRAVKYYATDL